MSLAELETCSTKSPSRTDSGTTIHTIELRPIFDFIRAATRKCFNCGGDGGWWVNAGHGHKKWHFCSACDGKGKREV